MALRWEDFAREPRTIIRPQGDEPRPEELREYLDGQRCWWCGKGGFQVVLNHIAKVHGIPAERVREHAGVLKGATMTDAAFHERKVAIARQAYQANGARRYLRGAAGPHALSTAGITAQQRNGKRLSEQHGQVAIERARVAMVQFRKGHACRMCGSWIPTFRPVLCSMACRRASWSEMGRRNGELVRQRALAMPQHSHPCPICGHVLHRKKPETCSFQCRNALISVKRRARVA